MSLEYNHTGKRIEKMFKCPECEAEFGVLKNVGEPMTKEKGRGLYVRMHVDLAVVSFCPFCGADL